MAVTNTVNKEVRELQKEMEALKADFQNQLESLMKGESTSNVFPISRRDLKALAEQAGITARAYLNNTKDQLVDVRDRTEARIQRRPFASTAIAFAAGAVIASLVSYSRRG